MRAAFFRRHGDPEVLEVGEAPDPVVAHGSAVVEVRAVAMNHLDLWVRRGLPGLALDLPHIGGSEVAGVVAELEPAVEGWTVGDRVVIDPCLWCGECVQCVRGEPLLCEDFKVLGEHIHGGAAEKVRVPATSLFRAPAHLEFTDAASVPLVFPTAWRALVGRARLCEGEWLLVTGGSGGVSTAAVQIGKLLGAKVVAITSGPENAERLERLGADLAIDRLAGSFVAEVRERTEGGPDVILDGVGAALWQDCLRCLGRGGRLVSYGATTGAGVELDLRHLFWKQQQVIGTTLASRREFEEVLAHVAAGRLKPVIDDVLPLDEIRAAHERLEAGAVFGKLVLVP